MDSRSGVILICGLGGLGQACLRTLMGFDAEIQCIDQRKPRWVDAVLAERYRRQLTIGDMRSPQTLRLGRAGDARAVLLLSHDSGVNLEAALQVRLINPRAQLVVRTNSSRSLERQLQQRLPGLATVDPSLLTAGVFANALRTDGSEAAFALGGMSCSAFAAAASSRTATWICSICWAGVNGWCSGCRLRAPRAVLPPASGGIWMIGPVAVTACSALSRPAPWRPGPAAIVCSLPSSDGCMAWTPW